MNNHPHAGKPAWSGTDWRKALARAYAAPRCLARCKHSKRPCRNPAVKGWRVCRMHGARGGGPTGKRNGAYRHGRATKEAKQLRRDAVQNRRFMRDLLKAVLAMDGDT